MINKKDRIIYVLILLIISGTIISMSYTPRYVWYSYKQAYNHEEYYDIASGSQVEYENFVNKLDIYKILIPIELIIIGILLAIVTRRMFKYTQPMIKIDKIPIDLLTFVFSVLCFFSIVTWNRNSYRHPIWCGAFVGITFSIAILEVYLSIIRRIVNKKLKENIAVLLIIKNLKHINKYTKQIFKYMIITIGILVLNIFLTRSLSNMYWYHIETNKWAIISIIFLVITNLYYIITCANKLLEYKKIKEHLRKIAKGDYKEKIQTQDEDFEDIITIINDVNDGLSKSVEEKMKSERLKTDLITNVSHDLKTPLTSIINYIKLLQKENIQDEKINRYIKILDEKSHNLKILTEDLIEISKITSGNEKVELREIYLDELIMQANGEFIEKFEEKELQLVRKLERISLKLDGNKMWRVLENIYTNIYKYSLENTRVYVDLYQDNEKVYFTIKNISKEQLNISPEELEERFVRGDSARNTKGNGLGLSIAKSLIELQNGKFNIDIQGDLFIVEIKFIVTR